MQKKRTIAFTLSLLISTIIVFSSITKVDFSYIILHFLIICLNLYGVFLSIDKKPYTLNKVYHIFSFFFFGLASIFQLKNDIIFFDSGLILNDVYLKGSIVILIINIIYTVGYHFIIKKINIKSFSNNKNPEVDPMLLTFLSLASFIIFLILVNFDVNVIFKRPANHWQKEHTNFGLIGYTVLLIIRSVPIICLLIFEMLDSKRNKINQFFLIFLVIITAFPLSLTRSTQVYYYLPLLIIYFSVFKKELFFSLFFLLGILFIFPILNFFRPKGTIDLGFQQFSTPHFDAFHNFSAIIHEGFITNGKQLLGSILFFLPKSIWNGKVNGTGHEMALLLNFNMTNISMPFFGEGYANFGYVGIFIFLFIIILLNVSLDKIYWENKSNSLFKIFFLFMLGFEFYLLRGDLYSSIKLLSSYLLSVFIVVLYINVFNFLKTKTKS